VRVPCACASGWPRADRTRDGAGTANLHLVGRAAIANKGWRSAEKGDRPFADRQVAGTATLGVAPVPRAGLGMPHVSTCVSRVPSSHVQTARVKAISCRFAQKSYLFRHPRGSSLLTQLNTSSMAWLRRSSTPQPGRGQSQ
jgi:hypothetical protein